MKKYLLPFFFVIIFSGIVINVNAQCPPTLTTTPSANSAIEDPIGTWTICPGTNILITSSPSSIYQWFRDGVLIDTATHISIKAKQAGEYYVMTQGCPDASETITINHFELPEAIISLSDSPVCSGETVTIELSGDLGFGWAWTEPEVSGDNPLVGSYAINTTFTAIVNSEDGCAAVISKTLIVHQPITPGDISEDQAICSETSPLELSGPAATGGDGVFTYQWQSSINSGGTWSDIPGATSLNYQPGILTQTTLFRRVVFSSSPCPAVTQYTPVTITVDEIPTVTSAAAVSICSREAVNYTITSNVPGTTFAWTGANTSGTVSGIISPNSGTSINDVLSIPAGGIASGTATYTIIPTGPAPTFCEGDPFYLVVTVNPLPVPTISGSTPICFGATGNLYATEPEMSNYIWTTSAGGTITSGQGTYEISVTWTSTGPQWVRVTYTGANTCDPLTPTQYNVTVNPLPDPIITGPNEPCLGTPGNVYSTAAGMTNYIWNVSSGGTVTGNGSTTDNTVVVTWNTIGTQWISLTYTDVNGCTNTTAKQFFVNVSAPTLSGPLSPCLGSTGNVYTAGSGNTEYVWIVSPGGTITSGGGSANNTATITWNATGAQTVSVNYKTAAGCTAASPAILNVDVKPLPAPTFIGGDNDVCAGATGVVYTTESGKSLYTWTISAGGTITTGGTPGSNTATVTWHTAGSQQISVNYTDINGCSAESPTDYPVTVNPQPIPTITGSDSECAGTTGVVYSTETGMSSYNWTISGGTITAGAGTNSIVVTWTTVGSRWVAVNYTDASGCHAATPTQYSVTVLPLPVPTVSGSNAICEGATNVEYATETGMSGYQWAVPTGGTIVGSSTNNNVFVTWNTVGSHTVSITYTGTNGCAASSPTIYNVSVNPLPTPSITGPAEVCRNSTANVYTTQPGMTNYVWGISGGTITAGGNGNNTATVTWTTSGNQSISVNYEEAGCPATSPSVYPVFVNPLPTVYAGPDQSIQNGTSTVLNGTASGGTGALSYQWTPVSLIASGANSLTPTTENIYVTQIFDLEVTDSKLCAVSDQIVITALGDPLSVIATASPDVICNDGATVQLGATATGGNSDNQADYTWTSTPAGFTSTAQNPSANPTFTTTYNVSVWDGFNTATNTILVTVNPLPTVFTVTGGGEYCAGGTGVSVGLNGSQTGVNYQLLLNGTDSGTPIPGTGGSISFTNNTAAGTYTIRAINGTTACEKDMTGSVIISVNPLPTSFAGNSELIPYGTNTTLTGVAGAGTPPYNYLWTPAVSIIGSNTSLTATTTNLYTNTNFTFRVTDSKTCVANDIVSITLDGSALAVTATAVQDIICNDGETVQLNASATGGNSSTQVDYSWTSTPAGFTSIQQSPQVNPTQTTIYYISVNDGYNTSTNSVTVTVNPLPTPFTITGGGEYCNGGSGLAVGLNGSQSGVNYQLLLNGSNIGTPIAGTGAALSFGNQTSAGLYTVHATNGTTTCERAMTGSTSISVNPLPVASAGIDKSINYGTSTSLNGSASSGTSPWNYLWTPANMINSGANTSNPVTENLYTTTDFELTITDSKGCTDIDQMQVIVVGSPLIVNASVDNSTICSGADAQLSATGSGGNLIYTYVWSSNPGSWTSTEQNPAVNPTITTDYTVTINDGYNTATSSVSIIVNPLAAVYNVTGGGSYCSGDAGVDVGLSNSETGVNYQLYLDGTPVGFAVNGTGSSISFGEQTGAGSYTVKATTAITGCENDMAAIVDIDILPLPNIYTMTGGGSYPQGGIGVIIGITNSQIGVNYQLLLNGSDIGTPVAGTGSPLDFGYQTGAGDYTAIGIDAFTGCDIEMLSTATVVINPYPSIFHVYGGGSICSGSSIEVGLDGSEIGVSYTLSRGGTSVLVAISGTGDSIHFGSFSTQGIYTVRAENISTGLTIVMDGNAEIIVNPLPTPYSLSYFQPGDNCVPIIPHLGNSETGTIYELNYEDFNGYFTSAIETINGTGNPINFSSQTNAGIYTASAYIDYTDVICRIDMHGSLIADSIPKEFQITPGSPLCENDQKLCLTGSEAGINYRLWLNSQPVGDIVPGDINGDPICFGILSDPGIYRIHAINTITGCEIYFTNQVVVNRQPIQFVMSPVADCAGSDIILEDCEVGIDYYLYHEPASKEFIEVQGPLTCSSSGPINFGPQFDEGIYRIKAVNPATNCWSWMDETTTIYPNPEIFEISPQSGGCAPLAIYLENFETDATYYLYRDATLVSSIAADSTGSVNFGLQSTAGTYTVKAKLTHPGGLECWSDMSGEVNIYNTATVFTLTPQGPSCPDPSVTFRLSGSEIAVDYTLWHDVSGVKETIVGTGGAFNFSPQSEPGQYWVIASTSSSCETQMDGIGIINEIPTLYSITPSGQFCSDDDLEIGLSNSDLGVTYYLYRSNTTITPQVIVPGTGNPISFGINNWISGTYTVMAIDDVTGCERLMDGTLVLSNPPYIYDVWVNDAVTTVGWYCSPATIGLGMSEEDVDYTLHTPDGNDVTQAGTGFPFNFAGSFSYPGEYSITAFDPTTACSSDMDGTVNIYDGPEVFILVSLTDPLYCFGDNSAIELVLNYSQIGANYQLYKDDDTNPVFAPQTGTGGPLNWTAISQYGQGDYYVKSSFIDDPTCSAVMDGVIPVEEIELPTAALSGTETICYSYCTYIEFDLTGTLPFEIYYKANGIIQDPVDFIPGNDSFSFKVCPLVNTTYEIVSIQYTDFPYCEGTDISGSFEVIVEPLPAITVNNPETTCITTPFLTTVITENTGTYEWIIISGNGSINPNNTENITYTPVAGDEGTTVILQLTASGVNACSTESVTELIEINVEPIPEIDMGANGLICETGAYTTSTTINYGSAYLWEIVSGNGTINPINLANTTYTAAPDDGGTIVQLKLTVTGEGTCANETVSDFLDIEVEELPTADAGAGGGICESESFQLNGSATNQTTVLWEVIDGIGSFDDASILNAIFTPSDVSNNTAMTLRLTVAGTGTCNGELATSEVIIVVDPLPEADAGLGGIICETQGYHFANASVQNSSSFVWEIQDGTGHFDDQFNITPVFYPDPVNQITDMILRLVAYGGGNCNNATDTSFVTISVYPQPVAYAGAGGETCVNTPFALADATAENQSSVLWEVVSGEGFVDSPLNVNPNYIPDMADAGTVVTLKLTAFGDGPCSQISTNDFVNIFIQDLPTVNAGPSLQTCFADAITITQASAEDYHQILWTHDGNGTLNNSNTINPTYIPAAGDEGNTITLILTAEGVDACTGEVATDQTTILVNPLPTAFAGLDATICELENYTILDASVAFESSVFWSVINGSGSIAQPFQVNTTYIPGASDAGTTVRLRLTVYGSGNCAAYSTFDEIDISVIESPIALFNVDSPVCENELVSFTDQSSTTAGIIEQWVWDFGDGASVTINHPSNPNVSHLYPTAGVYTVSLQVTTTNGCADIYSTEINISPAPVAAFDYSGGLCAESEVNFNDLSQENGGGNIVSWNWDFGDGSSSTEQNPSHTFVSSGNYNVSLFVTNSENCISQTFILPITIGAAITVTIDNTDLIACLDDPHQFNGISPEAVFWHWDFGDGSTSTIQNPTHTYTSIGNYTVTLTGSDINGCQNVDVATLTVSPNPIAFFTSDQSACVNEEINFIDGSISPNGQITEWLWDMGDGTVIGPITNPADRNVVHDYAFAGSYEVELTVTDINGCTDSFSRILIIENGPLANFTFDAACEDQTVTFMDLSTPNGGSDLLTWQWDFGNPLSGTNNSSNLQNPSHIFVGNMPTGGYTVTLTVTNTQGCFNTFQLPVEVNQNQTITIFADQNPICLGNPILFSSDATNVVSWQWNFGDGTPSTQANPSHTYQLAGSYNVTLNIQDGNGCHSSANLLVAVNELPTANFSNTAPGCLNETINFTDLSVSPNGAIVDWLWDFGDGNISNLQNPDNDYLTAGTFVVSLSVTDATGCTDTYQKTISIKTAPLANFSFEAACVGQPVIFTDLSSINNGSNIIDWSWNFGDPASGTANNSTVQNPTHIFVGNMPAGGFTVSLTITNVEGCNDVFETQVELNEGQTITITTDNDIHCLGEIVQFSSDATNVESWLWNFGDGNTSTEANPTHIYQFTGNYNVTLNIQDANGCTASDAHQIKVNELPTANFSNTAPGCPDETIHFTDLSISPNGGIANWLWDFGDGDTQSIDAPNDPNVDHIYANSGTYNVTLTVTDVTGCKDSFTRQIVTENAPLANFTFTQSCFGEPVLFTDLSSPNGGSDLFSWAWDFGDPLSGINNSSSLQNPSHNFTAPDTYTVNLIVTNTQGCSSTMTMDVVVLETVDIDFTTSGNAFCPGEIIQFTSTGINIVSYEWDFGVVGGTSIQQNPIYVYPTAGTYLVSLVVTGIDGCQGYVEHEVVINEEPVADFSTSSPSCSGAPTQFFNTSSSPTGFITEWIWNFGDGSPDVIVAFPANPDVEYTYAANGTYNATLTVTNSNGCSNSISHEVVIAPGPVAAFDYHGSCAESPVSFIDLSQENGGGMIIDWQWNFGDLASGTANTSTLQNPQHSFTAPGNYDVELIITNINECTDTIVNPITIDEALRVEIAADNETLCLGTQVNFTGTAVGAVIWNWDFGDGNTATVQNPSHTYTTTGIFTVSLTAETADGCSNTATLNVEVNPTPLSRFVSTSPSCSSDSIYFTNQSTSPNGFIQTFIWDMGDGTVITVDVPDDPNIAYLYANPGTYNVSLTVIDNTRCENTSSNLVQVEASPIADFSSGESCFGTPVFFTDLTSTNGGPDLYNWQWWFGDPNSGVNNTSALQNPTHLFSIAGTFDVTLVVTNTIGCSDTVVNQVIVNALPDVDFTIANDSICLNTSAEFTGIGLNINTWFWEFGDGGSSIQQSPSYTYAEPGHYDVTLTVTNINQCQNSISYPIFINDIPIADFSMNNGCLSDSTYFMDETVSLNGFIETWEWDFGDGNTANVQNPAHLYDDADDYFVTLTVTDNFGCFETISRWVSIYEKPIAAFSFNQVCDPSGKVFFFDESESSPNGSPVLEYEWNFHDGYFSNEINPNHIFPETDTCYVVSLTITDAFGCDSTVTDTICIWEPLTIDFTASEVCQGLPTYFEVTYLPADDSIVSYAWNFNDGSDIFLTYHDTTSHIFPLGGTYFVELTATNLNGCENTIYREVIVNGLPLPDFSYEPGLCDDPVAFTDLSDGNGALVETRSWDFGDPDSGPANFSNLRNPSHLYSDQGGIYQVKLIVSNFNGCIDSITKEVIQDPCVQASFIVPNITLCADSTICFTDNSYIAADNGTINRWIWNFGDNTPDYKYTVLENPVCHTFTGREGGEFEISLTIEATVNGNPFTDTHTETITIYPKPTARFIPAPVCQNTEAIFTDNSIGNGLPIKRWFWDFGDLTTIHDTTSYQNPSYNYPDYGLFEVKLVVSNEFDCTDSLISELEIYQPPTADFIAVDSCVTYITYFNDLTVTGGATIDKYFWHFGDPGSNNDDNNPWTDSTSTERWAEHIYNSVGTYFATLVVEDDNNCRDTVRQSLPVHPIPDASFIYEDRYEGKQGQVFFESTSDATATSFFWDFMTGDISNEENPVYQFEEDGLYDVMLIAYNDHLCQDTAINQYEIIFTGLYFPNTFIPNSEDPEVNNFKGLGENLKTYTLEVYTSWGQLIWSSTALEDGKPTEAWDGTYNNQDLPIGSYIWKASASFEDGTIWEGSDNGDGNLKTYGILNLIR